MSLVFDGTGSVDCGSFVLPAIFTVEAKVTFNGTQSSSAVPIVALSDSSGYLRGLCICYGSTTDIVDYYGNSNAYVTLGTVYSGEAFLSVVSDGATVKYYKDGALLATISASTVATPAGWKLALGKFINYANYGNFKGQISDVRIWDVALSASQIQLAVTTDPHLVRYYKLNETSGTVAHDSSGNGADGTLSGGCTWNSPVETDPENILSVATIENIGGYFFKQVYGGARQDCTPSCLFDGSGWIEQGVWSTCVEPNTPTFNNNAKLRITFPNTAYIDSIGIWTYYAEHMPEGTVEILPISTSITVTIDGMVAWSGSGLPSNPFLTTFSTNPDIPVSVIEISGQKIWGIPEIIIAGRIPIHADIAQNVTIATNVHADIQHMIVSPVKAHADIIQQVAKQISLHSDIRQNTVLLQSVHADAQQTIHSHVNEHVDIAQNVSKQIATYSDIVQQIIEQICLQVDVQQTIFSPINNHADIVQNVWQAIDAHTDIRQKAFAKLPLKKHLSINLGSKTLADAFDVNLVTDTVQRGAYFSDRVLDFPFRFIVQKIARGQGTITVSGSSDVDDILRTPLAPFTYTGNNNVHVGTPYRITSCKASDIFTAMAQVLGKQPVILFDDFMVQDISQGQPTYRDILSHLFGWMDIVPHCQVNVFIRGNQIYALQRGRELRTVEIDCYRSDWNESEETHYSLQATADTDNSRVNGQLHGGPAGGDGQYYSGTREYGGAVAIYSTGLLTTETVVNGSDTVTTTHEYDQSTPPALMLKTTTTSLKQTIETTYNYDFDIGQSAGSHAPDVIASTVELTTNYADNGQQVSQSKRITRYIPQGQGFWFTEVWDVTVDQSGNSIERLTSRQPGQGPPSGRATPYYADQYNAVSNTASRSLRGRLIGRNSVPVSDQPSLDRIADWVEWLDERGYWQAAVTAVGLQHVVDFTDLIMWRGVTYFLERNNVTQGPRELTQQLSLVRWA